MIAIIGSGKLTNFLIENYESNYLLISGTKKNGRNVVNVGNNLKKINKLKLPGNITHCIINWSHTYINKFSDFKYSINGFEKISDFIIQNPNVRYIFVSSTSADPKVNKNSLYGLSKYMAENIFLKVMEYNPKIKINFVRLGLIYGLEDCPIRKILFFRRYYIELYPGKPESFFAVTDPADLAKYLLDTTSIIWNSSQTYSNFYEEKNINLKYIHQKYNYYIPSKKSVFKYLIDENNLLIKIANLFGKNIDLSLSSVDRFPKNQTIVDYQPTKGFDLYLKAIFKI